MFLFPVLIMETWLKLLKDTTCMSIYDLANMISFLLATIWVCIVWHGKLRQTWEEIKYSRTHRVVVYSSLVNVAIYMVYWWWTGFHYQQNNYRRFTTKCICCNCVLMGLDMVSSFWTNINCWNSGIYFSSIWSQIIIHSHVL